MEMVNFNLPPRVEVRSWSSVGLGTWEFTSKDTPRFFQLYVSNGE